MSGALLGKTASVAQEYQRLYRSEKDHAERIAAEESVYRSQMLSAKFSKVSLNDEDFSAPENFMKRWGSCLLDHDHLLKFLRSPGLKFGDIYERSIFQPYNKGCFQTMRNTSITDQVYEFGETYVGFGFVDLFQLLWGSYRKEHPKSLPLTFYGYDMSRVVTLRGKIVYGAMKHFKQSEVSSKSILQIWFSSCWDKKTKAVFTLLTKDAINNSDKYELDGKDLILMKKWIKNEISVSKAKSDFAVGVENSTFDDIWHMKNEYDRVSFCRYIFTGILFADESDLVCGNPTMFTGFESAVKLMGELFFKAIDLNSPSFKEAVDLPNNLYDAVLTVTRDKFLKLRSRIWNGKIVCHFETLFLDPMDLKLAEKIKNLKPYGIDWSNIPDYMKKSSFIRFARACSDQETVHFLHFINWSQYVFGSCHVDWADDQKKCLQMYNEWKHNMEVPNQRLRSQAWWSKFIEGEVYVNPLNDINIYLSVAYKSKFEDYFLSDESGKKLNRCKEYSCEGLVNTFFAHSPTLFRAAFTFNDEIQL